MKKEKMEREYNEKEEASKKFENNINEIINIILIKEKWR